MEIQQNDCNIGIIGDTQCGKTLFLSSLPRYSRDLNVVLAGQDEKSKIWLDSRTKELRDGKLPTATTQTQDLSFVLSFRGPKADQSITIKTTDRSGIDFYNPSDQIIEYLRQCRGFIILINPNGEMSQFDTIRNTLDQIIVKRDNQSILSHRISLCLTQYDNPKFPKSAKRFVQLADEIGISTPLMSEKNAFLALKTLFVSNGRNYGDDFLKYLSRYWDQRRFNYFSISSVGFFVYPEETKVDLDHCTNIVLVGKNGKKVLRNGFDDYRPVHLLKPITWILSTTQNKVNIIK